MVVPSPSILTNLFAVGRGVTMRDVVCRTTGRVVGRTVAAGLGAVVPNSAADDPLAVLGSSPPNRLPRVPTVGR